jgi:hypothetical protein
MKTQFCLNCGHESYTHFESQDFSTRNVYFTRQGYCGAAWWEGDKPEQCDCDGYQEDEAVIPEDVLWDE